ncbi:MAG: phosphoribosylformylglycinamidine synthase subunit PurL [Thermoplasmatota archaeon]
MSADAAVVLNKRLRAVSKDGLVTEIDILTASDDELAAIASATQIGLSLDEMKNVRDHFRGLKRNPCDVELEALGQAWSEHCCYKSSKPLLKRHVYGIHEDRLIAREDAGVMAFDDEWAYVVKIESHNHPSAIEPYGGAATGIGGVVRDVLCMGAQPIALIDPLFFGPLATPRSELPAGTRSPRYLFGGVVAGIRDYGNRIGIPTVAGMFAFHPKFLTNPLVNVGCLGIMRREHLIHSRVGGVGDRYVLLGGRTGRDGIHGVTFASADLHAGSEEESRSAVQLGDPITKEPLIHACLELNEKGLLTGMKDLGGGGLSCVSGEMALDAGLGAVIELDRVPTKAPGMKPWEIWVSESQERMMVTVRPENVERVLGIARKWDVIATDIGEAVAEKKVVVRWHGETAFEMDSEFLYGGPVYERPRAPRSAKVPHAPANEFADHSRNLLAMLARENVASKELVIRQYDHEVRANTVIKPLQGKIGVASHGDATVLRPVNGSWKGLAVTCDASPTMTDVDPYWGTANAIDEVVRNLASVGARFDSLADNLNLPNPTKPVQMGDIEDAMRALGDGARALGVPFVSGNVSMYNESPTTPIPVTPSLLGVGLVADFRKCVTSDLKHDGSRLFLVGAPTAPEMGGSEYYMMSRASSPDVPRVHFEYTKKAAEAVVTAIENGFVFAAHDVALGGLAVTVAEMAFGGDLGARIWLDGMGTAPLDAKLFGESGTRWVIEARDPTALLAHFAAAGVPCVEIGVVGASRLTFVDGARVVADVGLKEARRAWAEALPKLVGALSPVAPEVIA